MPARVYMQWIFIAWKEQNMYGHEMAAMQEVTMAKGSIFFA